jgi:hypothetical protein
MDEREFRIWLVLMAFYVALGWAIVLLFLA